MVQWPPSHRVLDGEVGVEMHRARRRLLLHAPVQGLQAAGEHSAGGDRAGRRSPQQEDAQKRAVKPSRGAHQMVARWKFFFFFPHVFLELWYEQLEEFSTDG